MSLPTVNLLGCHEVLYVFVVSPDFKLVLCTFQELPPLFHCTDDRQHLFVMYLVVSLYLGERLREEGDGVPLLGLGRLLGQNGSSGKVRAVSFDAEGTGVIWQGQHWGRGDGDAPLCLCASKQDTTKMGVRGLKQQ